MAISIWTISSGTKRISQTIEVKLLSATTICTVDQRRNLLHYFMAGDPKGRGEFKGQMRVWIAYLYNVPEDRIPGIIEQYIGTHQSVDRAILKTGGSGREGLVYKLFYNEDFFKKLNRAGKEAFVQIDIDDVLAVLKRFCRIAHCAGCGMEYKDITTLKAKDNVFICTRCKNIAQPDFPKLIVIAKMITKYKDWFNGNLRSVQGTLATQYLDS